MQSADPETRISLRGTASLVVAIAVVLILIIGWPAYRLFFAISLGIGIVVAGILYLWHRFRPLKEEDIENKRPLGLS
jgi:uncharacterized membrane protein YqjE